MFTTAGFKRSATSANEDTAGASVAVERVRADSSGVLGAEIAGCGVIEPATISPMRNAMVAVRQTVTTTKRRVIGINYGGGRGIRGRGTREGIGGRGKRKSVT
jgi:hypothetical protein